MPPKKNKTTRKPKNKANVKQKQNQKQNQTVIVNIDKTRKPRLSNASKSNKNMSQPINIPTSTHTLLVERPRYINGNPNNINEPIKQPIHNHYYSRADFKEPPVNKSIDSKHFRNHYDYDESYNLDDVSTITGNRINNSIY